MYFSSQNKVSGIAIVKQFYLCWKYGLPYISWTIMLPICTDFISHVMLNIKIWKISKVDKEK